MNMRNQKRYIYGAMAYRGFWSWGAAGYYGRRDAAFKRTYALLDKRIAEEALQAVEEAKQEFVCSRVKDGTVVATFDSLADAQALVEKHIRGKKAKLQVMDSSTGELIAFEEEGV